MTLNWWYWEVSYQGSYRPCTNTIRTVQQDSLEKNENGNGRMAIWTGALDLPAYIIKGRGSFSNHLYTRKGLGTNGSPGYQAYVGNGHNRARLRSHNWNMFKQLGESMRIEEQLSKKPRLKLSFLFRTKQKGTPSKKGHQAKYLKNYWSFRLGSKHSD